MGNNLLFGPLSIRPGVCFCLSSSGSQGSTGSLRSFYSALVWVACALFCVLWMDFCTTAATWMQKHTFRLIKWPYNNKKCAKCAISYKHAWKPHNHYLLAFLSHKPYSMLWGFCSFCELISTSVLCVCLFVFFISMAQGQMRTNVAVVWDFHSRITVSCYDVYSYYSYSHSYSYCQLQWLFNSLKE